MSLQNPESVKGDLTVKWRDLPRFNFFDTQTISRRWNSIAYSCDNVNIRGRKH
jgi:hypothetical protein